MKDGKFNAGDIYSLLYQRYKDEMEFLCAREIPSSTGWAKRRLDFVACDCYSSKGFGIYAFEVKISKSDMRNELFDPSKHNTFFDNIDYFSIVAPDYVLDAEYVKLIPKQWGIIKAVAATSENESNKLITYRKPLALHDENNRQISRGFAFSLMRRLRSDPSLNKSEQELRNAEFQRGYEEGKRYVASAEYERLYKDVKEENELYRRTLYALGVPYVWYNQGEKLVAEAVDRAVQIKKYENVYNALRVMGRQIETIRNCVDELQTVASPLLKATEDAGKVTDEKPADILVF